MIKNISKGSSLGDAIKRLEGLIGPDRVRFAYLVASGVKRSPAFVEVFGYFGSIQVNRLMNGDTGRLVGLLREENEEILHDRFSMSKEARLEHILKSALLARHHYDHTNEAAHLAQYFKGMSIINSMTGDNAPTQVNHLVRITVQQLDDMTHSQRTEAYKRMMSGKLELIGDTCNNTKDELVTPQDRGDTLKERVV